MRDSKAKLVLRSEMVRRGIGYEELRRRLEEVGVQETSGSLRKKVSRGSFTADFFLQALRDMGVDTLRLG